MKFRLLFAAALVHKGTALFGWGSKNEATFPETDEYGCKTWVGDDGSKRGCFETVGGPASRGHGGHGHCECAWGIAEVDRDRPTNCVQSCFSQFPAGETGEGSEWVAGTRWHWNNWRDVEFLRNGLFMAPTADCHAEECYWTAKDGVVYILWGEAGMHMVRWDEAKQTLKGQKFNGETCTAKWVGRLDGDEGGEGEEQEDEDEDLYELLGLDVDATDSEVKKAFRKLSREYHPDRLKATGRDPEEAASMFQRVRSAYEVLSDPDKRILYDTGGMEAVKDFIDQGGREGRESGGFSMFFGGGRNAHRGRDMEVSLRVSLEDVYSGTTISTSVPRRVVCRGCRKITEKNRERCGSCGACPPEVRMVQRQMGGMIFQQQEQVPSKEKCKQEKANLEVIVEKGMESGSRITFERMSEQLPGKVPGDIIVHLEIRKHHQFERRGNNLYTRVRVGLKEALTGMKHSIRHLDGHIVEIETDPVAKPSDVISPGEKRKFRGEGMPYHNVPSQQGNLQVEFEVDFPNSLTAEQVKRLREILPDE